MKKQKFISIAIVCRSRAIGEFGAIGMLVGVTRMKTVTLPGSINLNISTGNNNLAMASALLLLIIAFLVQLMSRYLANSNIILGRKG